MKKHTAKTGKHAGKNDKFKKLLSWKGLVLTGLTGLLLVGGVHLFWAIDRYERASWQAAKVAIREQIINAVDGLHSPAPREAKTGDIYFPEARLFLPSNQYVGYLYRYETEGFFGGETLNITSEQVLSRAKVGLYQGDDQKNIDTVFTAVPTLQACARGYLLVYQQPTQEELGNFEFDQSVTLSNGRTLYVYRDTFCPYLQEQVDELDLGLQNIQAY